MKGVCLLFDAGPGIGLGHRRRMESLATSLSELGVQPDLHQLPAAVDAHVEVLVVDSYCTDPAHLARPVGARLVAVDDLGRDLDVDVLVDPNPGPYPPRGRARRSLNGPAYALVDPALSTLETRPIGAGIERIVVATGATDTAGTGAGLAAAVATAFPGASVALAVGPWGATAVPTGVEAIMSADGLSGWLRDADLVVTAAGVTLLEAMALRRPSVAVVTADNQRRSAVGASRAGATVLVDSGEAAAVVAALEGLRSFEARERLSIAAAAYLDGRGSERVAEEVVAL